MKDVSSVQGPVASVERIATLDILRGFALLGILVMNIQGFSMPEAAYFVPTLYGNLEGINLWVWTISHVFFDQKFMALFSMLFGAGIVLQTVSRDGAGIKGLYYRRIFWLLIFGLAHAYLLWVGDILTTYAVCGLLLFWCRNLSPRSLLIIGAIVLLIAPLLMFGSYLSLQNAPADVIRQVISEFAPSTEMIKLEIAAYQGGWLAQMSARIPGSIAVHTSGLLFYLLWRAGGLMLVGMAFYKWGILSGTRSPQFYNSLIFIGFSVGIPLVVYGVFSNFNHHWDVLYARMGPGFLYNYFGSILIAVAYVGLMMRIVQLKLFSNVQQRLAAVGRMALTNYLMHSLIATFIFYGFGLGLFGMVPRWGQLLIVPLIWIVQLVVSPIWLRHFKFGPLEWLWRSLTYKKWQPMRVTAS